MKILTLIRLGFLSVVFSEGGTGQFDPPIVFREELIYYQDNFMQFLNNLFTVSWKWKNAGTICYILT